MHHSETKAIKSNLRTIYKTSQLINHPFDALKLIIRSCLISDSDRIHIDYRLYKGKPMFSILNNGKQMTKTEFEWVISSNLTPKSEPVYEADEPTSYSYTKSFSDYARLMKYGGFKLGKGMVVSHFNE